MLFHSLVFLVFLPIVLIAYFALGRSAFGRSGQNCMLLMASYVFYGWWDYRFLSLLAISTVVDYCCARAIPNALSGGRRRLILLVSILTNLGILGFFKYHNFFIDSASPLIERLGFQPDDMTIYVILPMGISFYTFQSLSYTIDVYRGHCKPSKNFVDVALYVSFFPQLVAGPIERASHLLPQVQNPRVFRAQQFIDGLWLILVGYVKKVVIADRLFAIVDGGFTGETLPAQGLDSWFIVYAFAFQIYADFSAYSDIARGLSQLMGFELMKNFAAPYFVTNPSAFWRNWHISLSTWLRDYLYVPLGGNQKGTARTYFNLSVTMFLGGLWHGAGWAYIVWGVFQGLLLIVHRLFRSIFDTMAKPWSAPILKKIYRAICIVVFFHITCIGWLIFRVGSFSLSNDKTLKDIDQVAYIKSSLIQMFSSVQLQHWDVVRVVVPVAILALIYQKMHEVNDHFHVWPPKRQVFAVVASLIAIATLGVFSGTEFIYFQF